ncbi:MAG TPA: glycerol-3-phosphate 1-O-acyltransferase PlsY [bacterium]
MEALWPLAGFVAGSIPCSYLAGRLIAGRDVRREGSGNVGATNVFRVAGRAAGITAAGGDVLKSVAPLLAARLAGVGPAWLAATGAAVVLGHCYSPFLGFRGGKGVISTVVVALVLCWQAAVAFGAVWLSLFFALGYVSLASIAGALALPAVAALAGAERPVTLLFAALAVFVLFKHRANVQRLRAGTESRMRSR